ncbi:division/cell wall cluster transcriptional repressor MraZ [Paracraurococcus lichenis]|uniref:Transcriptional regulator MraZ n=1 Tax=Paracraurococcus lichenis TaxID=3064888 RepID=A0ABT9E509_9PROT|nr:cell division/cell wall cluster transcriptional repressor MraZ [Paracraurococcus sp. LOR1-02]MDO9711243.1 cell division/cell wall cluster transcriptional repressor MraZ [Paracraurococcus sp. LOR1-02]
MSGFAGTIGGTFDAKKGRISVPAPFRAVLNRIGAEEIVLRPSRHAPCIEVWPEPAYMAEVQRRVEGLSPLTGEYQAVMRKLVSRIHTLRPDAEGRLVMPKELAEKAALDGEIAFTGLGAFFQIWSAAKLAEEEARLADEDEGGDV